MKRRVSANGRYHRSVPQIKYISLVERGSQADAAESYDWKHVLKANKEFVKQVKFSTR